MEPQAEPPPNASAIIRGGAAAVAFAMFIVAVVDWTVGGLHRPGADDGFSAPFGNTQFYFAGVAAVASLVAACLCFAYALTEKRAGTVWIALMIAVTASVTWRIVLTHYCPGCGG